MPVFDGDEAHSVMLRDTIFRHEANAHPGSHQIQRRLGGVDGADDVFFRRCAAGPLAEAVFNVVVEDDLGLVGKLLRLQLLRVAAALWK